MVRSVTDKVEIVLWNVSAKKANAKRINNLKSDCPTDHQFVSRTIVRNIKTQSQDPIKSVNALK